MLGLNHVRRVIYERELGQVLIADDIAEQDLGPLHPDTDLTTAMAAFAQGDYDELPVVDAESHHVLGLLRRQDLLTARAERLAKLQSPGG